MKNKLKYALAGVGLVAVVIATTIATQVLVFGAGNQQEKMTEAAQAVQASAGATEDFPAWQKEATYVAGDKVSFEARSYEAKWWTKGEKPTDSDEWGVWKMIAAKANAQSASNPSREGDKAFKIIGYYPDWQPDKVEQIQYENLTHINYAFAIPTESGELRPLENPQAARQIITEAHQRGVKVLLAVGGWSYKDVPLEHTFKAVTSTDEKCRAFADNIIRMAKAYGFDGVDMDWEHPRYGEASGRQYAALMKYLNEGLKAEDMLLTAAVMSGKTPDGTVQYDAAAHSDEVIEYVDWINVMAYDGGDGERHSSYAFAVDCAGYWQDIRQVPARKIVLGVPFYGRPTWAAYDTLLNADAEAAEKDVVSLNGSEVHYNGMDTIRRKTAWALNHVGGVMIWEISQDSSNQEQSLLNAIKMAVKAKK